jgi:hypothetical protein
VDLEHNLLNLKDSKTGAKKVPLGAPAVAELRIALAESPKESKYVFPATRGTGAIIDLRKAISMGIETRRPPFYEDSRPATFFCDYGNQYGRGHTCHQGSIRTQIHHNDRDLCPHGERTKNKHSQ